ncbi:TPA_asm: putative zinc finger protein [Capsaspora MELD virus 1]|nr:TPA_asm: putative zinc finger protein [Capsaspora MELD virus 1]
MVKTFTDYYNDLKWREDYTKKFKVDVQCECGCVVRYAALSKHRKSAKHARNMPAEVETEPQIVLSMKDYLKLVKQK